MKSWIYVGLAIWLILFLQTQFTPPTLAQAPPQQRPATNLFTRKFTLRKSGLELERRTQAGAFVDVVGRKSAVLGYEHRGLESWVYPMKILDDFELSFKIEGYPLAFHAVDSAVKINARPEATTFTYSHAAFTVNHIIFAPVDEPGVVMLLDVQTALPMSVIVSFRPKLKLAWPAGLMTGNLEWDKKEHVYYITEESKRFVGMIGSPAGQDVSVMPYQEEPRDVPANFVINPSVEDLRTNFIPIVIAGSVEGREKAKAIYDRLLRSIPALYERNVAYYERLQNETANLSTPDERFNKAFAWAKVGVDKGVATNPYLGTGLIAGFRTSGDSERPGFAWYFGRDSLWTSLAINSYGDFETTKTALEFLKKFQRADGKIPHEISQSASLIPWFTDYEFPWNSADANPLYVIAHGDYWRATGDKDFLKSNWESIAKAYRFSAATDTDGNNLIENSTKTKFGHGWVEGGALYPPHEEIYLQGLWIEASRSLAEMATVIGDSELGQKARANAERTRAAMEQIYWLSDRGFYAFATKLPAEKPPEAESGPNLALRQNRLNELSSKRMYDEDTVLPAVPLWFETMTAERAQSQIDHLGSGQMATDWGARIISNQSQLYDPLSYHYGSVWPLFTGWASMGAYRYGRPHVGYQALMANALLTYTNALGYVTELLSGDFNAPFGRSSHHQIWSEAMVITPAMRGLLGIDVTAGGEELRFAPQLPANWNYVEVKKVPAGEANFDLKLMRESGRLTVTINRRGTSTPNSADRVTKITVAPAFPLDARVRNVKVQGRTVQFATKHIGDIQRAEITIDGVQRNIEVVYNYAEGTDVFVEQEIPVPGAESKGLRILRSRADQDALHLVLEGRGGQSYPFHVSTPHQLGKVSGVSLETNRKSATRLLVAFDGPPGTYVRRELTIPLSRRKK
ncbi:MAG TPA: GH116 family glycosyl hydrolase [Pyrinomonadaceae bacterium]|nr:GH116 family glycosyl hydrolase [Pyrinomonadaceae bacterium]